MAVSNDRIHVVHFSNSAVGGVFSVISNLLQFSKNENIENHVIFTINKSLRNNFIVPEMPGAKSIQVFFYSPKSNFYYTCTQLAKLLPGDKAILAAHDWLELGMISNLGLQNPVVHFVHGNYDYYYNLTKKHAGSTDQFICVSPVIYKKVCEILPQRKKDIHYCRFPIPAVNTMQKENKTLKIFYCVRSLLEENKQFKVLPLINARLKSKGINVNWTIVGDEISLEKITSLMEQEEGVSLFPSLPNEEILKLLPEHDIFILPSLNEGFPVTVVEAMKAGAVPLVTNWNGATDELITVGETGYYFKPGDVEGYADTISLLNADRKLLKQLSTNAMRKANEFFDPQKNTLHIEEIYLKASAAVNKNKKRAKVYGSRLDRAWMPNFITKSFRSI